MRISPTLRLDALEYADVAACRHWRNDDDARAGLRTPYMLTEVQQREWYQTVVSDRRGPHRYFAVREEREGGDVLVAVAGLTDIAWEHGHAEISLIVAPGCRGKGIGERCVHLVLREAFERMRLVTVFAEVYHHNPALRFWRRLAATCRAGETTIPRRTYWNGELHDAALITFTDAGWRAAVGPAGARLHGGAGADDIAA